MITGVNNPDAIIWDSLPLVAHRTVTVDRSSLPLGGFLSLRVRAIGAKGPSPWPETATVRMNCPLGAPRVPPAPEPLRPPPACQPPSERNLLFAGGVIGGAGNGERGGLGGERGGRRLKFEGRMMNRTETEVPDG